MGQLKCMILVCWRLKYGSLDFKASLGCAGRTGKEVAGAGRAAWCGQITPNFLMVSGYTVTQSNTAPFRRVAWTHHRSVTPRWTLGFCLLTVMSNVTMSTCELAGVQSSSYEREFWVLW